jgi:ABC-type branched-subunit amino acid transport system ATPase component
MGRTETERLAALIDEVRKAGRGVLLVDHDMGFIFSLCDAITVMNAGRVIADGTPREIEDSAAVREAYLGADGAGLKHGAGLEESPGAGDPLTSRPTGA